MFSQQQIVNDAHKRPRRLPEWYGKRSAIADIYCNEHLSDNGNETFEDSLNGDLEYIPFERHNENIDHGPQNRKRKTFHQDEIQQDNMRSEKTAIESYDDMFDEKFDVITASIQSNSHELNYEHSLRDAAASEVSQHSSQHSEEFIVDGEMLLLLYKNSVATLSRITTLEKAILNSQIITKNNVANDRAEKLVGKLEQFDIFMKSKRSADDINGTSQ